MFFSIEIFSIFILFHFLSYIHNARGTNGLAIVPNVPLAAPPPYPSKRFLKVEKLTLFIPIVSIEVEYIFTFSHFLFYIQIIRLTAIGPINWSLHSYAEFYSFEIFTQKITLHFHVGPCGL